MVSVRVFSGSASPLTSFDHIRRIPCPHTYQPTITLTSTKTLQSAVHVSTAIADTMVSPHPSLEVIGGALDSFLPAFKTLDRLYNTYPIIGWNRHAETIFAAFFRSLPDVRFRRECIRTKDDGAVALDWVSGDDRLLPADSPVLILLVCVVSTLFPLGLTGGSGDTYVRHMLVRARSKRWRTVVFNSRGCGDSPVITSQFYSASFLGDMVEVVAHVGNRYPKANLYAVGWSLGANILVRYLGEESHTCPLSGAASLCNPFNLVIADEDFHKGFNIVYDKALANSLCKIFKKVEFYPSLLLSLSLGDLSIIHENPNCLLIVTPQGGHLGWVAGTEAPRGAPWTDPVVMDFLEHLENVEALKHCTENLQVV
ncbi:unnamed protein product [Ilex paraguariensis]|uniref:AB hydrolase-1 domain-containing protein n=1 Tax=Ilex paraguariensis TaxID=185542 RepID=A0ABC8TIP0_9AQUA